MVSLEQLHTLAPQLATFVTHGGSLVAAYHGTGGVFAVYQPASARLDAAAYFICTMRQRPTLVEVEGSTVSWHSRELATRAASALAADEIRATPRSGLLSITADQL